MLSDLCNEDASIIFSTTPTEECDRIYMKLDLFLGFFKFHQSLVDSF